MLILFAKKVFAGLAVLRRIRPFIDDNSLKLLYMSLVQSQMITVVKYGAIVLIRIQNV